MKTWMLVVVGLTATLNTGCSSSGMVRHTAYRPPMTWSLEVTSHLSDLTERPNPKVSLSVMGSF